jgi:hypothetical protein
LLPAGSAFSSLAFDGSGLGGGGKGAELGSIFGAGGGAGGVSGTGSSFLPQAKEINSASTKGIRRFIGKSICFDRQPSIL